MAVAQATEHIGETKPMANHDHDMVHDLSKRIDAVWRYDQYIANAEGKPELKQFWERMKRQDQENVSELKQLIAKHIKDNCF